MANRKGLTNDCDNCIFVKEDVIAEHWLILRTKKNAAQASVMFSFETYQQATCAGSGIAKAIGGIFFDTIDPRL